MLILGITGGTSFEDEYDENGISHHDSAAVLVRDGEIICAIEEERLNRIKHTNCFPIKSINFCLQHANCSFSEIDVVATNNSVLHADLSAKVSILKDPTNMLPPGGRAQLAGLFQRAFGVNVTDRLYFCNHHIAHAWSAFAMSGFSESLILSIDGDGDSCSGMALVGRERQIEKLRELTIAQSLGRLYESLIRILGYTYFDEYKVMGLAPYGDPRVFRDLFEKCYRLLPDGNYDIEPSLIWLARCDAANLVATARRKGEPFTQSHKDFAAALQATVERIVIHLLRHFREKTGLRNLCLAGGVAHNCSMNGQVLYSGLFDRVFVQPAAHDAGGAIGAALCALYERQANAQMTKLRHVYFGTAVGNEQLNEATLCRWSEFLLFRKEENIAKAAAALLASGGVVGWIQGRSEFGPRALGNRSILADPRPSENKLRINQMIKKREEFRPFAPSVLEERAPRYFTLPSQEQQFPFMIFVLKVRKEVRSLLGAVTHVDGTARVQTVSRDTNPLYWELISEFEKITGIPMVLNTSFNNNAEPIVDDLEDAITCFLTTGIHYLAVGNFLVQKKPPDAIRRAMLNIAPALPTHRKLARQNETRERPQRFELITTKSKDFGTVSCDISRDMFDLLQNAGQGLNCAELLRRAQVPETRYDQIIEELMYLWSRRVLVMKVRGLAEVSFRSCAV